MSGNIELEASARDAEVIETARRIYKGPIIGAAGFTPESAEKALRNGDVDLVAFGRAYVGNPDFVRRVRDGIPIVGSHEPSWYTPGAEGYIDYPPAA